MIAFSCTFGGTDIDNSRKAKRLNQYFPGRKAIHEIRRDILFPGMKKLHDESVERARSQYVRWYRITHPDFPPDAAVPIGIKIDTRYQKRWNF